MMVGHFWNFHETIRAHMYMYIYTEQASIMLKTQTLSAYATLDESVHAVRSESQGPRENGARYGDSNRLCMNHGSNAFLAHA